MFTEAAFWQSLDPATSHILYLSDSKPQGSNTDGARSLLNAMPFLLATLYYVLTPVFAGWTRKGLIDYLEKLDSEWHGSPIQLPPHLAPQAIASNTDWIADAPQMIPTLLLPLAGAVLILSDNATVVVVLGFSALIIPVAAVWIYMRSPVEYRRFRFIGHRYTIVSLLGIVLNAVTAALLLST